MADLSEQEKAVRGDRFWLIARLFVAWAVIEMLSGIILNPLGSYIRYQNIEISVMTGQGPSGFPLLQFGARALFLLLSGYVVLGFFKDHWAKVGFGIPLISLALTFWNLAWAAIFMPGALDGLRGVSFTPSLLAPTALMLLSPFIITLGVLLRRYLPPNQIRPQIRRLRRLS